MTDAKPSTGTSARHGCRLKVGAFVALSLVTLPHRGLSQQPDTAPQVSDTAPSPPDLKTLSVEELMNVVVTSVSRRAEPLSHAASAIQVITQEDIRRSGATSLPEALRLASNLQVAQVDSRQWAISAKRATPSLRVTQEQGFQYSGYQSGSIRRLFLNTGIDFRHFYFENALRLDENSDELNQRYLHGAMETGCKAVRACLETAGLSPRDVDLLVVCTSTGYVCPDIGSRLIGHLGLRPDVQRASMVGLGCAGAIPRSGTNGGVSWLDLLADGPSEVA